MTQPPIDASGSEALEIAALANPLHDIAKAAYALAANFRARAGEANENDAFQALIMARLIAAAHEVSTAQGKPDKGYGQAHYAYRNASALAEEALHMIANGGEVIDIDRQFIPGQSKTRKVPYWWEKVFTLAQKVTNDG